jgi:putative PEP-CTERM system TPR-repeat lipoprotein
MKHFSLTVSLCLAAALCLQACGGESEEQLMASAKAFLDNGDAKAAVIQLKNVLQERPDSPEARYLLGKALLVSRDGVAASVELRKAGQLGYAAADVAPELARAMLLAGEERKLVELHAATTLPDPAAMADLKTSLATAYARLGERDNAQKAVDAALAAVPGFVPAQVFKARVEVDRGQLPAALARLDEVLAKDPRHAEAWLLKGQIALVANQDQNAALSAFEKAVQARPDLLAAHEGMLSVMLKRGDTAAAKAHVAQMKKTLPNHVETQYFEARLAYLDRNFAAAREIASRLVQAAPGNAWVLELAGAAEFQLKALPQAQTLLANAVQINPQLLMARQLLAQTYLRSLDPARALATLQPLLDSAEPGADALAAAAQAHLLNGDAKQSEAFFARAATARPADSKIRAELALTQLVLGRGDKAISDLDAVASADKGSLADMALISAHLKRNDLDKAMKAIDALEQKQPDKAAAAILRGRVHLLRHDATAARSSFERALSLEPGNFPATLSLAGLDMVDKKPQQARQRFDALLRSDPKNHLALLSIANLLVATGADKEEVTAVIQQAIKLNPTLAAPRVRLVDQQLTNRDYKAALASAQDAASALPGDREVLYALGRAQLGAQAMQQAVTTFNKLAALEPASPRAPIGLADAYTGLKDARAAERSLKHALEISPDQLNAQRGLVSLALADQRPQDALAIARAVQKQRPAQPAGYQLEGDVQAAGKHWDAAAAAYRAGLQKAKSTDLAVKLHALLLVAGKAADAERFAASWEKEQPGDAAFQFYLGDGAMAQRDFARAERRYRAVLALQPENALALNNVAWLLMQQGKPGALALAEKANQEMPNQPPLMDTLATALAAERNYTRALEVQRQAVARVPADPAMRLNLARLLIGSGDKVRAKTELESLSKLGDKFPEHAEVARLLLAV